jgi:hypothetical protein
MGSAFTEHSRSAEESGIEQVWLTPVLRVPSRGHFFRFYLNFRPFYGIIPTCWLENQRREHQ